MLFFLKQNRFHVAFKSVMSILIHSAQKFQRSSKIYEVRVRSMKIALGGLGIHGFIICLIIFLSYSDAFGQSY